MSANHPAAKDVSPHMRKLILLLATVALLASAFSANAVAGDPPVRAAATKTVKIGDSYFSPKSIKVRKNDIVKWVWGVDGATETSVEHNVRGYKGNIFQSPDKVKGIYRKRITRTTLVVCTIHPTTMKMKITVR